MSDSEEPNPLLVRTIQFFLPVILWFGRHFLRWNRLSHIELIRLETPIEDVYESYGEPIESKQDDGFPEATMHTFSVDPFHEAVIVEWKGKAHSITYWSEHSSPTPDLECMLKTYRNKSGWKEAERGYWYFSNDLNIKLWYSAAPAIGVATSDYLSTAGEARQLKNEKG